MEMTRRFVMASGRPRPIVTLLLLLGLLARPAARARAAGVLFAGGSPDPLEVAWQRIDVSVIDQVAVTRIRQTFRNHTDRVLEGEYRFTLAPGASVSDFAIWEDGERVAGVIRRKQDARRIYEHIVRQQRDPGLLEQVSPTLFQARVYPIPARSEKRIEIEYRELLPLDEGLCRVRVPLVAPGRTAPRVRDMVVNLDVKDGGRILAAWSAESELAIHHRNEHEIGASYEARDVRPDRDMDLSYRIAPPATGVHVVPHRDGDGAGFFLLTLHADDPGLARREKDVVFVVDVSGSMKGVRLQKTKEALKFCLTLLEPSDRFDLVRFSSGISRLTPPGAELPAATDRDLERALGWVDGLEAHGGTNLEGGIREGLNRLQETGPSPTGRPRYLVVLSDGEPTLGVVEEDAIHRSIQDANAAGARIFTFGIGEVAGSRLLAGIAGRHRGETLAIRQHEQLENLLPIFFGKLVRPLFDRVEIDWGGAGVEQVYPRTVPAFYLGRAVNLVGRYRAPGEATVRIRSHVEGRTLETAHRVSFPETAPAEFLPRLWAQRHVADLLDQSPPSGPAAEVEDEIVRLSTDHVFVTPFTSFIAVPEKEKQRLPAELLDKLDGGDRRAKGPEGRDLEKLAPAERTERIRQFEAELARNPDDPETHFQLALLHDATDRPDAARKTFEHAKHAIRLNGSYKPRFQKFLANSQVARQIGSIVQDVVEKSEQDQLTDEETERYALRIQEMLGGTAPTPSRADAVPVGLDGAAQHGLDRVGPAEPARGPRTGSGPPAGASDTSRPRPVYGDELVNLHRVRRPDTPRRRSMPVYVDKLTRTDPDEAAELERAMERWRGPATTIPEIHAAYPELIRSATDPADEAEYYRRVSFLARWQRSLQDRGLLPRSEQDRLRRLQKLYYTNRIRAAQMLDRIIHELTRLEGLPEAPVATPPSPVTSLPAAVEPEPAAVPSPGAPAGDPQPFSMDAAWHEVRAQIAATRARVRWLRGKLEALEALIGGTAAEDLPPAVEAIHVAPAVVRGGEIARIGLTLRHSGDIAPRMRWRCREGRFLDTEAGAALWLAPDVPGSYTLDVVIHPARGEPRHESVEVEVYQPGRISYAPELLDARVSLLDHALRSLRDEHRSLEGRLDLPAVVPEPARWLAGLVPVVPTVEPLDPDGVSIRFAPGQDGDLWSRAGRVVPGSQTPATYRWEVPSGTRAILQIRHRPVGPCHWTSWIPAPE